jgi:hypothetical protein
MTETTLEKSERFLLTAAEIKAPFLVVLLHNREKSEFGEAR